jgi:hypothetical protein
MPLLPETVTQEWRFPVAESVPVPLSGSDLEALIPQACVMPPGSAFPSLTEDVRTPFLLPAWSHYLSFVSVCLPFPGLTGTLAFHKKLIAWYLMT